MTEHQHQAAFFRWFRMQYPHVLAFAIPNAAKRGPKLASMMKAEGLEAGIPDVLIADGKPGLFIEMKKPKSGKVSEKQKEIIPRLQEAGYQVAVCYGWEAAKDAANEYLTKGK